MACSSLYQSLMVSPGVAGTPPIGLNVRSTSLSLKVTFVRGSLLENGYMIEQFVIGQLVVLTLARWLQQPAWHAGVVHASPSVSVHGEPSATLVCAQVPAASQKSFVHSLLSLHLPVCMQLPVAGSQLSFVHGSLSLQVRVVYTQPVVGSCRVFDGSHPSSVQALLSLHVASLRPCWQPFTASQVSVVHATPSSQRPEVSVDEHTPSWTPLDLAGSQKLSVHCVSAGQNSTVLPSSVCARGTSGSSMARVWENAAM